MKVCTDACLFGSLLPISSKGGGVKNVLDIGTGTGLLSLMYAQKNIDAIIDAVEVDEAAAQQAKKNFQASPWKERLRVFNTSIQQFNRSTAQLINNSTGYDLIISNPPFFENHLKSNNARRNLALHNSKLSFEELLNAIDKNLKDEGIFAVLLAHHCLEQFINLAHQKLFYPAEKTLIKQMPRNNCFRSILLFTRQEVPIKQLEIIIQDEDRKYTNEFVESLKDYYLDLTSPKGGL